ncbi:MAG: class I SAM-dependent methyltransferase [Acidobacteriia bacterium]|nr:class I SAM-dependent methyltransferase [Terriglobia bacterium]
MAANFQSESSPRVLTADVVWDLLRRYNGKFAVAPLSYGTVRDYCDSVDHVPTLSTRQKDLKDLQRPWMVKAILGRCAPGSKLLEIGAGEPLAAQILLELGYKVVVVDPYDGSGRGPVEYDQYRQQYPAVELRRALFAPDLPGLERASFDCIFSISVLEHIHEPTLGLIFQGIRTFLKPDGLSLHAIDYVLSGHSRAFHRQQLISILSHQSELQGDPPQTRLNEYADLLERIQSDDDLYLLSAESHNLWRGAVAYDEFPYRRVISVNSCKTLKR